MRGAGTRGKVRTAQESKSDAAACEQNCGREGGDVKGGERGAGVTNLYQGG